MRRDVDLDGLSSELLAVEREILVDQGYSYLIDGLAHEKQHGARRRRAAGNMCDLAERYEEAAKALRERAADYDERAKRCKE